MNSDKTDNPTPAEIELGQVKDFLWPDQKGLPNQHRNVLAAIKARLQLASEPERPKTQEDLKVALLKAVGLDPEDLMITRASIHIDQESITVDFTTEVFNNNDLNNPKFDHKKYRAEVNIIEKDESSDQAKDL